MHYQQLIQGILQGIWSDGDVSKRLLAHLQSGAAKIAVDKQALVWSLARQRIPEVELKLLLSFIESPSGTGIEELSTRHLRKIADPLNANANIVRSRREMEWF
jgi:hypothetical protein